MPSPAYVATFIVDPGRPTLSDAFLGRAAQALPGFTGGRWLDRGVAADLYFDGDSEEDARAALAPLASRELADVVVQPLPSRTKRLLVADTDSTLIGQECIDELAEVAGAGPRVAEITERAMRGEIEFESALRERVALLADLPTGVIDQVPATRITLTPGAPTLVRTMRKRGGYVAIVSGGFVPFAAAVVRWLGADERRANRLRVAGDHLTGELVEPVLGADAKRDAKRDALRALTARMGLAPAETPAVGDGANDLAMLAEAGLGVAYRAKPRVAAAAHARIDHADLTALLYAQGLSQAEFVEA